MPDGQPLVWALNLLGHRLKDRVYGPDLMDKACARAARTGRRMYLYGGRNEGALVQLTRNLRLRHPGLRIVGGYVPPFRPLTADEEDAVAADIHRTGAEVVWVGIGVPKQEKWMARMSPRLRGRVLIGVGAAFDFHAGLIPQAPATLQRLGLEWAFRLAQEPRRLWRRYLRYNPRFVVGFAATVAARAASLACSDAQSQPGAGSERCRRGACSSSRCSSSGTTSIAPPLREPRPPPAGSRSRDCASRSSWAPFSRSSPRSRVRRGPCSSRAPCWGWWSVR